MPEYENHIAKEIEENSAVVAALAKSCSRQILEAAHIFVTCLRAGGKLLVFGNGGSAAEAEHFVTELVGRYRVDRRPLAAIALTTDSTSITAIANDYGFEQIFSRQLQALAKPGDVVLAISTSGNSPNVLRAVESAKSLGVVTVGLTGLTAGKLRDSVQVCICVPSHSTPRIQEAHALVVHILCGILENEYILRSSSQLPESPTNLAVREAR